MIATQKKKRSIGIASTIYASLVFVFMYAPIVVLIAYSFNDSKSQSMWGGFTFRWYKTLLENSDIMHAVLNTLKLSLSSALIATVVGTLTAIGLFASRRFFKNLVVNISYIPMLNSEVVTGVSLLLLFSFLGISLGFKTLLLAHITFNIPYVILSVMPKLKQMAPNTYEAALDLGAKPLHAIRKVILPEIMPGVFTGFLLAITMSIDDFIISFFTVGPGESTLSITIYTMARRGIKPEINALSTLLFLTVLLLLIVVNLRTKPKETASSSEDAV